MDVRLPNGTLIQGIPEGTSKDAIREKAISSGLATAADFGEAQQPGRRGTRGPKTEQTGDGSILNPIARGATLGFADKLIGAAGAAYGKISGDIPEDVSFGEAYRGIRDEVRADEQAFAERSPSKALAGEIAGGLMTGGAIARQGLRMLPAKTATGKIGAGAAIGAAEGGLYGAGTAEEGQRLEGAAKGATIGAATGGAGAAVAGAVGSQLAKRAIQARKIQAGSGDKSLARYKVSESGRRASDAAAKAAIGQGFDDGFVQQLKTATPVDKSKILRMVRMGRLALRDNRYAMNNRINQVVGDSLSKRVNYLNKTRQEAGSRLDEVAESLKPYRVDHSGPVNELINDLESLGVTVNTKGQVSVDFTDSMLEAVDEAQRPLTLLLKRAVNTREPNAWDVHRLKRFIDNMPGVVYGKVSDKSLKGEALSIIKKFRANLDNVLDTNFPEYNQVNTQYADTIQALDALQDAWGGKVNMFNQYAPKQLGIQSRKLLSNYASGTNQLAAIENAESIIRKYGGEIDDNIMDLVSAESALRSVLPQKYFNTYQGDMEKGVGNVGRAMMGDKSGIAQSGVKAVMDKISSKSPEDALKALERLLKESR